MIFCGAAALIAVVFFAALMAKGGGTINAVNTAAGTREGACVGRFAETALGVPYLVVSKGTVAGKDVIPCAATGAVPLGFALDAADVGEPVAIAMGFGKTVFGVASAAIAADVPVYTAAGGELSSTGGAGKYLMGRSVTAAAADNDVFELMPCFPVLQA